MKKIIRYSTFFFGFNFFILGAIHASALIEDPKIYKFASEFLYSKSNYIKTNETIDYPPVGDGGLGFDFDAEKGAKNYGRLKAALANKKGKEALEESFNGQIDIRSLYVGFIAPRTANISDCYIDELSRFHPKLARLNFSGCPAITGETFERWGARFPNLVSLDIHNCANIGSNGTVRIGEHFRGLREIDLSFTSFKDDQITVLAERCPGLREVNLRGNRDITDIGVIGLAKHCKGLRFIDLSCNSHVTDAVIIHLAEQCKMLLEVCLGSTLIGDAGIIGLAKHCRGLRLLYLGRNQHFTDAGIIGLAEYCMELQEVNFQNTNVGDAAIASLAKYCVRLQKVNISASNITDAAINHLAQYCKGLQEALLGRNDRITDSAIINLVEQCADLKMIGMQYTNISNTLALNLVQKGIRVR